MKTILSNKYYNESSVFLPENLLREARRQKNKKDCNVPPVCLLDPDGDLAELGSIDTLNLVSYVLKFRFENILI